MGTRYERGWHVPGQWQRTYARRNSLPLHTICQRHAQHSLTQPAAKHTRTCPQSKHQSSKAPPHWKYGAVHHHSGGTSSQPRYNTVRLHSGSTPSQWQYTVTAAVQCSTCSGTVAATAARSSMGKGQYGCAATVCDRRSAATPRSTPLSRLYLGRNKHGDGAGETWAACRTDAAAAFGGCCQDCNRSRSSWQYDVRDNSLRLSRLHLGCQLSRQLRVLCRLCTLQVGRHSLVLGLGRQQLRGRQGSKGEGE